MCKAWALLVWSRSKAAASDSPDSENTSSRPLPYLLVTAMTLQRLVSGSQDVNTSTTVFRGEINLILSAPFAVSTDGAFGLHPEVGGGRGQAGAGSPYVLPMICSRSWSRASASGDMLATGQADGDSDSIMDCRARRMREQVSGVHPDAGVGDSRLLRNLRDLKPLCNSHQRNPRYNYRVLRSARVSSRFGESNDNNNKSEANWR